jgi:hypothetical protein
MQSTFADFEEVDIFFDSCVEAISDYFYVIDFIFQIFFKVCRADWPSERNAKKPHKSVPQSGIKTSGVF